METVVVAVDAVVDVDPVHVDAAAFDHTDTMVGAVEQRDVADRQVLATVAKDVIGAPVAAESAGRWAAVNGGMKLCSLAVDGSGTFDGHFLCIDGEEQSPVAVFKGGVSAEGDRVDGVILLAVHAAQ
jgi:hypothetical protein